MPVIKYTISVTDYGLNMVSQYKKIISLEYNFILKKVVRWEVVFKKFLNLKIIPAIDILDGKCVRLSKGKYDKSKIYNKNPVDVALEFQDNGVEHLHIVDLDR